MKDKPYIALAYMTGILPIKKYGKHSALNMFTEYSMTSPKCFAEFVGFTKEDVKKICGKESLNYYSLKEWYDGYRLSNKPSEELMGAPVPTGKYSVFEIYCPLSVVNAALYKRLENYWNKTETYEALAVYIRRDYDGLKDAVALLMDGGRLRIDTSTYQNDMTTFHGRDDVLSLLIHLGYLGYDDEAGEVFIPNREILDEFRTSTKSEEWMDTFQSFEISQKLLKATWNREADKVAELRHALGVRQQIAVGIPLVRHASEFIHLEGLFAHPRAGGAVEHRAAQLHTDSDRRRCHGNGCDDQRGAGTAEVDTALDVFFIESLFTLHGCLLLIQSSCG